MATLRVVVAYDYDVQGQVTAIEIDSATLIGRHRPWDTRSTDKSFWDRF